MCKNRFDSIDIIYLIMYVTFIILLKNEKQLRQ